MTSHYLKSDHSKNSMAVVVLTQLYLWHQSMWKLQQLPHQGWELIHLSPSLDLLFQLFLTTWSLLWNLEDGKEKFQKHYSEHHRQKYCIHLLVFPCGTLFMHGKILQSSTSAINRTAEGQLQDSSPELFINESIERVVGIPLEVFHHFCTFLYGKKLLP